ncbi:MAG: Rpn family recombination-promoting nuclease/putative transposase [Bacteroidetes bacterium]|nr:Rpn family recombination-promoting nuclease/putative transposase [Bacteroidota bacterium]
MRYLDPKNDLTFRKVFGQHPKLLKSFLNAMLPLTIPIRDLEYLPAELVPVIPALKYSIVDVRCVDKQDRQFIVEMQMLWTDSFKSRVLFNASKAYVRQLDKGIEYKELRPVYALSLVNEVFEHDMEEFYHHYKIVHLANSNKILEGLEFVFVEIPKFKPSNFNEKKIQVLWLRYLSEIKNATEIISPELYEVEEIRQAIELLQESGYSKEELIAYDKYWDSVSIERSLLSDSFIEGKQIGKMEGKIEGKIEGKMEGKIEGKNEGKIDVAKAGLKEGYPIEMISKITGLTEKEINDLKNK